MNDSVRDNSDILIRLILGSGIGLYYSEQCVNLTDIRLTLPSKLAKLNLTVSIVLLLLGIIGNSIAIYCLSPGSRIKRHQRENSRNGTTLHGSDVNFRLTKSMCISAYILKTFFLSSLLAVLTLILNPILSTLGQNRYEPFWISRGWAIYLANIHYPVSKILIYFCSMLYILFFANQVIAVIRPHQYVTYMTMRRVHRSILVTFLYCLVWYAPIARWYTVEKITLCFTDSKQINTNQRIKRLYSIEYAYVIKMWFPEPDAWRLWTGYEIARELMVTIIPFIILVTLKIIVIRKRRAVFPKASTVIPSVIQENDARYEIVSTNPSFTYQASSTSSNSKVVDNALTQKETTPKICISITTSDRDKGNRCKDIQTMGIGVQAPTQFPKNVTIPVPLYQRRREENRQHISTLIVLSLQFIFLMLPMSIMEILIDVINSREQISTILQIYMFLHVLQFTYVSGTFYFNFAFNSIYRNLVCNNFRDKWMHH